MSSDKNNLPSNSVDFETIKTVYICESASPQDISNRFNLPIEVVNSLIEEHKLSDLRAAYLRHNISELQNIHIKQAETLMSLEGKFKKMRITQLETILNDYMDYYKKHGHFYKVHPLTGEILKDTNNIPIQIKIPNVTKELSELRETFSLSEGLKQVLGHIDEIINKPKDVTPVVTENIIDASFEDLFKKKDDNE